jgi:geranylgeranyl diphosphate synthase type II
MDVKERLIWKKELVDRTLENLLPSGNSVLDQSLRYAVLSGGKRFRPLLTLASGGYFGLSPEDILPYACSLELIHNYSLVHDDLPSMDNDDLRRGRPTCHRAFGEDVALLAGDALLTLAFEVIAGAPEGRFAGGKISAILELGRAAGIRGMIGGQFLDISRLPDDVDEAYLLDLMRKKTGALITAAVRMGGIVGGADSGQMESLTRYGENLGLAFQTRDDIMDAAEDGGKDHIQRPNAVQVFGLNSAKSRLEAYVSTALKALNASSILSEELHFLAQLILDFGQMTKKN